MTGLKEKTQPFTERPESLQNDSSNVCGYGFTPPPKDVVEKRNLRFTGNMIGFVVVISFGLMQIMPGTLQSIASSFVAGSIRSNAFVVQLLNMCSYLLCLLTPFLLYAVLMKFPLRTGIHYRKPDFGVAVPAMLIGLGVSMVGTTFSSMLSGIFSWFRLVPITPNFSTPTGFDASTVLYIINIAILPALVEELIFRGIIMQTLRKFGDGFALLVSSVVFAVMHRNLVQGPNAFLMGLVIGYFVMYTGSIWTGVLMHFINNGLTVAITLLMLVLDPHTATIVENVIYLLYIVAGVLAALYLAKRYKNMFTLRRSKTELGERQKCRTLFLTFGMLLAGVMTIVLTAGYFQRLS